MTKKNTIIVAIIAFVAGCMGGPSIESLVVRPLSAQQAAAGVQRWEYQCVAVSGNFNHWSGNATEVASRMGAEGWSLSAISGPHLCFGRPL